MVKDTGKVVERIRALVTPSREAHDLAASWARALSRHEHPQWYGRMRLEHGGIFGEPALEEAEQMLDQLPNGARRRHGLPAHLAAEQGVWMPHEPHASSLLVWSAHVWLLTWPALLDRLLVVPRVDVSTSVAEQNKAAECRGPLT